MNFYRHILFIARIEARFFVRYPRLLVAALAVALIPALYAIIYLSSVWDPASNTGALPVGLVNLDTPVTYRQHVFNVGDEVVAHLKTSALFGYQGFADEALARQRVREGKLAFALIIPKDFSSNALPGAQSGAGKLVIFTSEGNNYEAAGLARRFAGDLGHAVNESLNERRWTLVLNSAAGSERSVSRLREGAEQLRKGAKELSDGANQNANGARALSGGARTVNDGVEQLTDGVKQSIRDTALLATALLLFGAETAAADGPIAPARPSASSSTPAPAATPTTTTSPAPAAIPTTTPTATPAPTTTTTTTDDRGETSEPDLEAGGGDRAEAAGSPSSVPTGPWSAPVRPLDRPVVVLYGDSLAWEARHVFEHALADEPVEVVTRTFGGTAICDWLDEMADDAATLRPGLVILEFVGNNYTPCMQDASGAPVVGQALVDRYGDDAAAAVATFASADTEVVFAGAPISQPATATLDLHLAPLNAVYEELARELDGVGYTDAGAAVLDDGTWTATLPCLRIEPCADGDGESGAGHNVVRAPDGLHFCPANEDAPRGVTGDCPVWSSGAFRFGAALAEPVLDRLAA